MKVTLRMKINSASLLQTQTVCLRLGRQPEPTSAVSATRAKATSVPLGKLK